MASSSGTYRQYFDVDEKYFPCFDDSAINAGAAWDDTYPHEAFIKLLEYADSMLSGTTKRSIWIHGAYGTGKSKCAYALKRILEVSEEELKEYWNRFDNLKGNQDLFKRICGHKRRGIVTAYRYASGSITTPNSFFFAIQESVSKALHENPNVTYYGENTLKESVIAWLGDDLHKEFFDGLLKRPKWSSVFAQRSADEVIDALHKQETTALMENISQLASEERIDAMYLDADMLKDWLKDVIRTNGIRIVFVWDEFSGFFKQNRNSLDEFQKIVALCQEEPFYLVIVTHQTDSIINRDDPSWSIVQQRFEFVPITLPDNLAFELIAHAFSPKKAAVKQWAKISSELNLRLSESRDRVMAAANVEKDSKVIQGMLPIHPMTALALKNISEFFQSNQRSMFDFIKTTGNTDVKAFQWFIANTGPLDEYPLLTIDLLWDFFYEKGRDNLTTDIRMILDTYPQQQNLRDDQQRVLKTILIMEAIDKRLGGAISLIKPTDQNISYAFEGTRLDAAAKTIASDFTESGILVRKPLGGNKFAYGVAVLAGDQGKIDEFKVKVRKTSTAEKLAIEGGLGAVLEMSPSVSLRYENKPGSRDVFVVTLTNFTKTIKTLKARSLAWHFNAVLAIAKDEAEAAALKKLIKESVAKGDCKDIIIIDALSSPLGQDDFEQYVEFSAMSMYYTGNNNQSAADNDRKAKQILNIAWKNRIRSGAFYVYYEDAPETGERVTGGDAVNKLLQAVVLKKYPHVFDFADVLTEAQFKTTQAKASAKCGIVRKTARVMAGAEKKILKEVWSVDEYWKNPEYETLSISKIKLDIDELISKAFEKDGQISIGEIKNRLEYQYGFAPSNLTAFLIGFLLGDYAVESYRYSDSAGDYEPMSDDKLAEMIGNCVSKNADEPCIVMMTSEEMAFYELTEGIWDIDPGSCNSLSSAGTMIRNKMHEYSLPVWVLSEVDDQGVFEILERYISFVQLEGREAHRCAVEIGGIYQRNPEILGKLRVLLTKENCQKGMSRFLTHFDGGLLKTLAEAIGATDRLLGDISAIFEVPYANLWDRKTGEDELRSLIVDYTFVKETDAILDENASSKQDANEKWSDRLVLAICSSESLSYKYPSSKQALEFLLRIYKGEDVTSDMMAQYVEALASSRIVLKDYFDDEAPVFLEVYSDYTDGLGVEDVMQLISLGSMFARTRSDANAKVKKAVEEYRKNQAKTQLHDLWKEKTGTKSPEDWSNKNRTPILAMVEPSEYSDASRCFDTLNRTLVSDSEIKFALAYLTSTSLFEHLNDQDHIDECFRKCLIRKRSVLLDDIEKVRDGLDLLPVPAYQWKDNPQVHQEIARMASAEYNAGGSERAVQMIDNMSPDELKTHLIELIRKDMDFGMKILSGGE